MSTSIFHHPYYDPYMISIENTGDSHNGFSNVDIDISDDLLEMLIRHSADRILRNIRPCSFDIWQQKCGDIEDINDLHKLIGECLINDELVDAVIAGIEFTLPGERYESYYTPNR